MQQLPTFKTGRPGRELGVCNPVPGLEIPFGIIEGAEPGPCLLVTAGVHGSELCAIETALRLFRLEPSDIRGSLVVLPILNPQGFTGRSIYTMPQDGKNLNRMFPGRADGSLSEQLAHWLVTDVYRHADAYVDLHGGDLNEDLTPFTLFPVGSEASKALACAFGLPIAVATPGRGFTIDAAVELGVPSLIAEVGGNGLRNEAEVSLMLDGVFRVLRHLGMDRGKLTATPGAKPEFVTLWSLSSPLGGLWYPSVPLRAQVKAGQVLGDIRDVFGKVQMQIFSEASGTLLYRMTSLAVNQGEPLLGVGIPIET